MSAARFESDPPSGRFFRAIPEPADVEVHQVQEPVAVVRRPDPVGMARFARFLAARFGKFMPSRKRRPGRERMVQVLVERCDLPRRRARSMINRLEKRGLLHFVRGKRRNGFIIKTA